jgi:hypothetical protein
MISKSGLVAVVVAVVACYYYAFRTAGKPPSTIVTTNYGKVQGIISLSRDGRQYSEYLGIPFAKPPVGQLRFEVSLTITTAFFKVKYKYNSDFRWLKYAYFVFLIVPSEAREMGRRFGCFKKRCRMLAVESLFRWYPGRSRRLSLLKHFHARSILF